MLSFHRVGAAAGAACEQDCARRLLRFALQALLAAAMLLRMTEGVGQGAGLTPEHRIKAAYVYRFTEYVEWPRSAFERPDSAFVMGVLGNDLVADELARIVTDRKVNGRTLVLRELRRDDALEGLHLLFIGASESARTSDILAGLMGQPVLTVTESEQAFAQGSMINLVPVEGKFRFDISLPPAEQSKLRISARLLSVARKVVSKPW